MFADTSQWRWPTLIGGVVAICAVWFGLTVIAGSIGMLMPLAVIAIGAAGYVFWQAALCKPWALLTVMVIGVLGLSITFFTRTIGDVSLDPQNGLKIIIWLGMLGICILNAPRLTRYLNDFVLTAFACYCFIIVLSTIYSPVPLVTGSTAIGILAYLAFGCLIATVVPARTIFLVLIGAFAFVTALCVISAFVIPDIAYLQDDPEDIMHLHAPTVRLQGIMGNPNNLGRFEAIYMIVVVIAAYRGYLTPIYWIPNTILAFGVMWESHSRTSLLGVILALLLQIPRRFMVFLVAFVVFCAICIVTFGDVDTLLRIVGRDGTAEDTLTMAGRTDIWDFTWGLITAHPVLGYGFNSYESYAGTFWTGLIAAGVATHNNYLSVLYSNGIIGALPLVLAFGLLLYRWLVEPEFGRDFIVMNVLISGFAEIDVFSSISPEPTFIFAIVIALEALRRMSLTKSVIRQPVIAISHR